MKGLDILSYANVKHESRIFAHVFLSWVFFGSVTFFIYREIRYYITFRHVLQTTPLYDSLLSSKTLFLTEIPVNLFHENVIKDLFPAASKIWYARDYSKLKEKVEERSNLANKYENALNGVLKNAVKKRNKALKKDKQPPTPANDLDKYLKDGKNRPTHKLKFLIGKKVDTLNYCPERLGDLNAEIESDQSEHTCYPPIPAVFIEFPTQFELQRAFQAIPYNPDLKGVTRRTGVSPDDVIWDNLRLSATTRRIKKLIATAVLTLMIIFWSIPVAIVGIITNINMLTDKVKFLQFINNMPDVLLGLITGLLPVVALAILMALVPVFIRLIGNLAGFVTFQDLEAFCHSWYYAFQVIQTFLVVTIASAATSAITSVINKPESALTILGEKVPPASNFYIANTCYQSLALSSGLLLQIVDLILPQVMSKIFDDTPRAKWTRYNNLNQPVWSVIYPPYQLISVIALVYAIIAPLILGFAAIAFILLYFAYLYFLVYVQEPNITDNRGKFYPRALMQLFAGIYLGELCLVALFVFKKNWATVVLEIVWIVVTAAVHIYLTWKYVPLFDAVPLSAIKYASGDSSYLYPYHDHGSSEIKFVGQNYWKADNRFNVSYSDQALIDLPNSADIGINAPQRLSPINWLIKFFNPKKETFELIRSMMPRAYFKYIEYFPAFIDTAYYDPVVSDEKPVIWIAKDNMGLSDIEMEKAQQFGVDISNDNATFDENGDIILSGFPPSYKAPFKV
uniref:Phosphate metabolism protein 7 n=1 Tax=Panagrolaimus sp. PS1159 TaxID=55785 RepID=A0AC35GG62_9BILA